jgi:hypothetical protein
MAYISNALRQLVAARAKGLCEYCQTAQTIVIEMELDHIVLKRQVVQLKPIISALHVSPATRSKALTRRESPHRQGSVAIQSALAAVGRAFPVE